jgi:hypothetical protein
MARGIVASGTYIKRENEKNILRMNGGSWTINIDEIDGKNITMVKYITDRYSYWISIEKAISVGFERILGGERKLVVPLVYWQKLAKYNGSEL